MNNVRSHIMVCGGTGCIASKSDELIVKLNDALVKEGYDKEIDVVKTGCFGFCGQGPIIKVHPDNVFYVQVQPEDAEEIVAEHIVKGRTVDRLLFSEPMTDEKIAEHSRMNFYKKQYRIALRNCGLINPEDVFEYIAFQGYEALANAVSNMKPEDVIKVLIDSNLRGRGGGGFPTGVKLNMAANNDADQKYIICNADEGDPGAFMDRSILEGDPHSVLEAMAIAGYGIGASEGIIYIRAEYPLAIHRLEIALAQAAENGLLGDNIFGSDFSFKIRVKLGAGAFVCGEETALIRSVEGARGEPTKKPPYPATSGLNGKPTCVNNVETYANIPSIMLKGAEWFNSIGTEKSKGTKVFALAGKVNNVGLVEVPMGTTLREIIFDIGGGILDGRAFKAVQTGGPSGGVITVEDLDTPIDYESLKGIGSMMGSGGMIVMDETDCMVNIAKFYLDFTQDESCGKCTPCRIGTKRMYEILHRICEGDGVPEDLTKLKELGNMIKGSSLCGLGQTAPNPVLSTMHFFMNEYEAHINDKKCLTGTCKALAKYSINEKCIGCTACVKVCPVDCIKGKVKEMHVIDQDACIACGACYDVCKFDAVVKP